MILTYEEYRARGGALDEAAFSARELAARKRLELLTGGRLAGLEEPPEEVKQAVMAIIAVEGEVGAEAQARSPMVTSFVSDGYSESYGGAAERTATLHKQLNWQLTALLWNVRDDSGAPLLYRGLA